MSNKPKGIVGPLADYDIEIPEATNFSPDLDAANNLIRVAGIPMRHFAATICPVGLQTLNDSRRSGHDHRRLLQWHALS